MSKLSGMTPKERMDAILNHQPTDRTPFCVVDAGAWAATREGVSYAEFFSRQDAGASVIVQLLDEIESDVVNAASGVFTACMNAFGCPMDASGVGIELGIALKEPEEEIPLLDKTLVREKLLANDFVQKMLNQARNVKALVGDRKYIIGDIAGPFTMASVMVGTSDFMYLLLDDPDLAQQLIDYTTCISTEMYKLLHEAGCDIAVVAEPVASGSMISQDMFEEWVVPGIKNLKKNLSEYKYFCMHICGNAGARVAALRDCGINYYSVDYQVDMNQALTDADGRMVMLGNVNPAGVLLTGTPEEVYAEACGVIRTARGRGHILAPGCDIGGATTMENAKMLVKACKDMAAEGQRA